MIAPSELDEQVPAAAEAVARPDDQEEPAPPAAVPDEPPAPKADAVRARVAFGP